jgi:outer membrane protein OmpA-like peptidoglycan-associated protein
MHHVRSSSRYSIARDLRSGSSVVPVLIIVAGLIISTVIFFAYTKKLKRNESNRAAAVEKKTSTPSPEMKTGNGEPKKAAPVDPVVSTPPPPAAPPVNLGFARPADVGDQLVRSLSSGDFKSAAALAAAGNASQTTEAEAVLNKIFKDMGYKVDPADKIDLLGQVENYTRLSIPLRKPGELSPSLRLQLDLERDEKMGWKIGKLHLPKELSSALAELPANSSPSGGTPAAGGLEKMVVPTLPGTSSPAKMPGTTASSPSLFAIANTTDALSFANDFVKSLLHHDFAESKKFIDETKVPAQKLAGLCIVFEEGQYELKPSKPLVVTIANPEVSWVIAQVQSESLQQSTEFGLELQRASVDQEWKVVGLNLSEILGSFAQSAGKMGVPYTPLVKNPKGGESLALYFEYDRAELHPRAKKQLEIVAGLLKSDPNRKLNIAGHTDALGDDSYNVRLSRGRAESVKTQLVELGVPPSQVITEGLGKAQPLGPNQKADGSDDPEGRSKNRRAEIFLDF